MNMRPRGVKHQRALQVRRRRSRAGIVIKVGLGWRISTKLKFITQCTTTSRCWAHTRAHVTSAPQQRDIAVGRGVTDPTSHAHCSGSITVACRGSL